MTRRRPSSSAQIAPSKVRASVASPKGERYVTDLGKLTNEFRSRSIGDRVAQRVSVRNNKVRPKGKTRTNPKVLRLSQHVPTFTCTVLLRFVKRLLGSVDEATNVEVTLVENVALRKLSQP